MAALHHAAHGAYLWGTDEGWRSLGGHGWEGNLQKDGLMMKEWQTDWRKLVEMSVAWALSEKQSRLVRWNGLLQSGL